ncbi:MAG: rRNA maturation RNase YbeY [Rickettsiales bacterium]|nr:rRNA maturation RNase YbeY [Rickettsiales bacterium]
MSVMIDIDVELKSKKWLDVKNPTKLVEQITSKLIPLTELNSILKKDFTLELAISLVSNAQIKKINALHRNKDKATNILSFPNLDHALIHQEGLENLVKNANYLFLGDIVIAYEKLKSESKNQNKSFNCHLTHLILHSILHLIGFDHEDENQAKEMENLEVNILKILNINNPYQ